MLTPPIFPKIEPDILTREYGRFIIGAMEPGFGVTLGNALRRVLLSALPGAAITSIRITDVHHEFSDIPHVREDVMQLMLNIKQIRLRLHGDGPARLRLEVRDEGVVTAGDIIAPPEVEIVNRDLYLFTVDSKTMLDMEMQVQRGRGYSPAEQRERLPIGELPVDAIFSPVRRVSYTVEPARVGQTTSYDRLVIEVWTDGTIRPQEALAQAANILLQHLRIVASLSITEEVLPAETDTVRRIPSEWANRPIEDLELSVRVFNALKRTGISTVGEVLELMQRSGGNLTSLRNFGEKSMAELREKLRAKNLLPEEGTGVDHEQEVEA